MKIKSISLIRLAGVEMAKTDDAFFVSQLINVLNSLKTAPGSSTGISVAIKKAIQEIQAASQSAQSIGGDLSESAVGAAVRQMKNNPQSVQELSDAVSQYQKKL